MKKLLVIILGCVICICNLNTSVTAMENEQDVIFSQNWMIEDEDEFLLLYWTQPQTGYGALFNDSELVDGHGPICHIMVYRDKKGKYYLCIKREGNDLY